MATTRLSRTVGTPTLNTKYTISMWLKRSKLSYGDCFLIDGYQDGNNRFKLSFDASDRLECYNTHGGSYKYNVVTNRKFRDVSAFYHLVVRIDTTQASAAARVRIYVNGTEEDSFSTYTDATQNDANNVVNESGATISIGDYQGGSNAFDGIMSHVHFVDGTSYAASTFGSTDSSTGEWKINTSPSITMGNNGFTILKDGNTITDQSSNSNNFTLGGGTLTKTEDCPDNVFATLNTLVGDVAGGYTIINGNLSVTANTGDAWRTMYGTIAASKGKFYFEQKIDNASGTSHYVGASEVENMEQTNTNGFEDTATSAYCYRPDGGKVSKDSLTGGWGASWTAGDIIGTAIDIDNLKIYFSKNGVWQASGDPTSGATGTGAAYTIDAGKTYTAATATYNTQNDYSYNFGNGYFATSAVSSAGTNASGIGIFEYDVPTGYTALSTKGLNL